MGGVTVELSSEESLDESPELSSEESLEEPSELSSEESPDESLELSSEESLDESSELSSEEASVISELLSDELPELSVLSELSVPLLDSVALPVKPHAPIAKAIPKHKISINNFFIVCLLFIIQKERGVIRYHYNRKRPMLTYKYNHNHLNEL
jgi:hypothetical protein